ncbi:MAG: AtpZ/AtpI family protein [Rhodospirillales bacterium]
MSGNSSGPRPSFEPGPPSEAGPSFEQRLRTARERQGLDTPAGAQAKAGASGWGGGVQAGVELVSAELVAGAMGWGLDHLLHTLPLFLVIFVLLGGAAGVLNAFRRFAPANKPGR